MAETSRQLYKTSEHFADNGIELLNYARSFAVAAHIGQHRASGEPFIEHPIAVAQILSDLRCDPPTIAAGLLHDVVEDTAITLCEVRDYFGSEIAFLVDSMTKVVPRSVNLAKFTQAMSVDPRVALIRLADRLHNMRTLGALPQIRQRRMSSETLAFDVPLAHCFGLREIADELQRLAFIYLEVVI